MYQHKVDVDMQDTLKSVLADVSSISPEFLFSLLWRRANARNVSQHTLYGVQHIHINLTLIHCTFYHHKHYQSDMKHSVLICYVWKLPICYGFWQNLNCSVFSCGAFFYKLNSPKKYRFKVVISTVCGRFELIICYAVTLACGSYFTSSRAFGHFWLAESKGFFFVLFIFQPRSESIMLSSMIRTFIEIKVSFTTCTECSG